MLPCLFTEGADYTVKHPLVCGTVFGDVLSKTANRDEIWEVRSGLLMI